MKHLIFQSRFVILLLGFLTIGISQMWGADPTLVITQDSVQDFTASYNEYTWKSGNVTGKLKAYKNAGMQFNNKNSNGYYLFNSDAVPGKIKSIKMESSSTARSWTIYVADAPMSTSTYSSTGTSLGAKNVGTSSSQTWTITDGGNYTYFYCAYATSNASVITKITITYETPKPVTSLILSEAGNETDYKSGKNVGDKFTLPTETEATCGDKELVGWSEIELAETDTKPSTKYHELGEDVTLGENNKFYAVFANIEQDLNNFAKGSVANLTNGQVVVIHDYSNNKVLTTEGYSSQTIPSASITPSNNKIPVSSITDKMKWTVGVVNGKYTFRQGSSYLMAASSYLKFGTTPQTQWTLTAVTNGYKFSQTDQTSYPHINYSSNKFDIASSNFSTLNVFIPAVTYSNYATTCAPTYAITTNNPANGSIKFSTDGTNWSNSIADQQEDADVFFKLVPNAGYRVEGTPTVSNVDADDIIEEDGVYFFYMPAVPVIVSATFSCATPTFKTDLVEQTIEKVQNVGSLTLNVEKNESWATYQWQSSANKTDWVDIAGKTSASYSPSIATIGTTYYRCLLKNGVGSCGTSAPSNVVTLVVNAPSKCETPTFSLATGTYNDPQSVELHCVTEGATIYYTTDGTEPSTSSTEYTGAINVFKTMTIRAIAAKDGIESSEEGTITYTIQYTVTFNMQSHGQQVADQKVGYEGLVTDPKTQSITGWTFGGWFKEGACNNQWNFATDKVTDHTTLYAKWTMTMFDVKFYNNGNLVQTYNIQDGEQIGTLPTLTSSDAKDARSKTFVGWTEDKLTNWQEQAPTPVTSTKVVEGELTLNAVWAKGGTDYEIINYDDELTSGNYVIAAYYSSKDYAMGNELNTQNKIEGTVISILDDDKVSNPDASIVWEIERNYENQLTLFNAAKNNYLNIVQDGYYGKLALGSTGKKYTFTITDNGQYFNSWVFKSVDITGQQIENYQGTYTSYSSQSSKIYLYKQNISDYITHSSSSPLASITLNTDNVKKNYFVGETFTSANLTATAKLEDGIEFPIEYNDLTISTPDLTSAGETVTVEYTFNGATKSAPYTVNAYSVTINKEMAHQVDGDDVNGNKAEWSVATKKVTLGKADKYEFDELVVDGATSEGSFAAGYYTLSNPTKNVTVTAKWHRLFTLQYEENGGNTVSDDVDKAYNTAATLPTPSKTGYNFAGWFDNEQLLGDALISYSITSDATLYAKWEVKTTEITLSQADATTKGTEKVIATWGQPMPTTDVTMPQREHYQFAGYKHSNTLYYNADGSSAKNWDKEFATATLTAQWTINKHNIILPAVLAGGTLGVSTGTSNVSYDATVTITPNPNAHYTLTALTYQVGENTPVSIKDNPSFKMPDADVTIAATFTEDTKRTISWSVGGSIAATTNDVYDGTAFATIKAQAPNVDDKAADACADKFMGWAIAPINTQGGIDKDAVQWADEATTSETQNTFYAVFASKVGEEPTSVEFTPTSLDVSGTSAVQKTQQLDDITFTFSAVSLYSKKARMAKSSTISQDKEFGGDIISISFDGFAYSADTKGSLTIKGCATANGSYTTIATQGANYAGASVNFTSGYKCFKVEVGSERTADFSKMIVKYKTTSYGNYITQCCTTPTNPLEITNTNLTVKTNGTLKLNTTEGIKDVTKVWASKNGAVATVDQEGLVTPVSTGKAIITVSQAATNGFCAQYDEVEIEVIAANEFGISFTAAEGGSAVSKVNGTQTSKATTDTQVTIEATTASDDYNFTGWTVNAGGVTLADASKATTTFVMGEADVEITPSFAKKQFTITLDAGNGKVDELSVKKLENQDIHSEIELPDAVACNSDEWEFKGWAIESVEETTTEPTFVSSTDYEVTDNITLYAVYGQTTTVDGDYKYKIYAQVGETRRYMKGEPVASSTKVNQVLAGAETEAQTYTLVTIDASKYALKYTADATSKYLYIYKDGSNYYLQSTTSLSEAAYWTMSDGAKGGKIFTNVQYNTQGILFRASTYNVFKVFGSLSDKVTENGTEYYDLTLQVVGREQTTGGIWNSNPSCKHHYQVTYDGNGTTTTCTSEKLEEGEITLCADAPVKAGYEFAGWNDETNTYAAGAKYNLTAPVTFTAVWNPIKVTAITLNVTEPQTLNWKSDLASAPTFQLSVASTTPAAVADNSVTWSVSEGTAVSVSATGLVTAVEAGTATLTATANDGSGVTANCTFTVTKTYKLTITDTEGVKDIKVNTSGSKTQYLESGTEISLSKTVTQGYTFEAWVVKQGETPITVTDNKFTMPAAEVTVTATFTTKKDYYVDDMNDNEQIVMEGKYTVPSLPDVVTPSPSNSCEQTHLYFVGWIETEISSGQTEVPSGLITAGTENKAASGKTYHAVWAEDANNNQ